MKYFGLHVSEAVIVKAIKSLQWTQRQKPNPKCLFGNYLLGIGLLLMCVGVCIGFWGCDQAGSSQHKHGGQALTSKQALEVKASSESAIATEKVGVLLVSHGSHSENWRGMLTDFGLSVQPDLLKLPNVQGVKSAFMEYTEPSIATQLKAFDQEGYDRVILVPLLLTVSSHSFDDIPTIYGAKQDAVSLATLEAENIERYTPEAEVTMTPLLDFSELMKHNLARRVQAFDTDLSQTGVVVVGYGSKPFMHEWQLFFDDLDTYLEKEVGVKKSTHSWCGHVVMYQFAPTIQAIEQVIEEVDQVIVIPALVAVDDMFQNRIIGGAVAKALEKYPDQVIYRPDSILPEPMVEDWVCEITRQVINPNQVDSVQVSSVHVSSKQPEEVTQ